MTQKERADIYYKLPLIYNHIMRKINYKVWSNYIYTLVCEDLPQNASVLELASGNCNLANNFVEYYKNIIATDVSRFMLQSDKQKALTKVCCDMTKLPFKRKFDLIFCTFDSINYLTSRKKIVELFKEVSSILKPEGIFSFDASLEKNSIIHARELERKGNYKGVHFTQKSEYDKLKKVHKNIFSIKLNNSEVFTEVHKQKIYPFETYFELLEIAGLYTVNCYEAFSYKNGSKDSERIQFITKRAK